MDELFTEDFINKLPALDEYEQNLYIVFLCNSDVLWHTWSFRGGRKMPA